MKSITTIIYDQQARGNNFIVRMLLKKVTLISANNNLARKQYETLRVHQTTRDNYGVVKIAKAPALTRAGLDSPPIISSPHRLLQITLGVRCSEQRCSTTM